MICFKFTQNQTNKKWLQLELTVVSQYPEIPAMHSNIIQSTLSKIVRKYQSYIENSHKIYNNNSIVR